MYLNEPTELHNQLDTIEAINGHGTELVTVSATPETNINSIRDRVRTEHAQAANIKSDTTQDHVQRALDRIERQLQQYDTTPSNGIVIYAGVPADTDDVVSYTFDSLPNPVESSTYTCTDHFDTSVVYDTLDQHDAYALVIVERGHGVIGEYTGDNIRIVKSVESQVMGKTRAGGQSAPRFERERERQTHEFFQQLAHITETAFIDEDTGDTRVAGVVVGGTTGTVEAFIEEAYLDHRLQDTVVGPYSVSYANETGLRELVSKAEDDITDPAVQAAIDTVNTFFTRVRESKAAYGIGRVRDAAEYSAVDTLLVADERATEEPVQELVTLVEEYGGDVVVVPTGVEDGARFNNVFTGVGAILRFEINSS